MSAEELIPLTKERIPTIVGFDVLSNTYEIGEKARLTSLRGKGKTAVFNFKPAFGSGDKEFSEDKPYWFHYPLEERTGPGTKARVENFSAKQAALRFLRTLFERIQLPEAVIVGEPGVREETWRKNFRRHMREVFSELGLNEVRFFPEPFAVFQYYRHVDKVFPVAKQAETVLVIDIGGGTFNSCIIRTTEQGLLARAGATAVPLGLQADLWGGAQIDLELLKVLINEARKKGLVWKDNPITRVENEKSPALLRVEEAKIKLSDAVQCIDPLRLADDFSHITTQVFIPKGECHPESDIEETLTGENLKNIVREMWRRHYGAIIADTVNEAREKLAAIKIPLERIDKVLVAGGSSRLPFMKEEIHTVLPTLVDKRHIFVGTDIGEAVAYGIACECREQVKRDPKLSVGKIAPCVLNDLYLGFREMRRSPIWIPQIKLNGALLKNGQLLSAPFETETSTLSYEVELPFNVSNRLFYVFTDKPIEEDVDTEYLNVGNDVLSVPKLNKLLRKCELQIEINLNGMIKPIFHFRGKGDSVSKSGQIVKCPEFYYAGFQVKEGNAYVGFDFGTSNSYLVRFASIPREVAASEFPQYTISRKVKDRLRELEIRVQSLREQGSFGAVALLKHAEAQALDVIFHSNKIEGNPLTKGETEEVLSQSDRAELSEKELEAQNLETAYYWMLDHVEDFFDQPEAFTREINRQILQNIKQNPGQYRTEPVSLSGMDFVPPPAGSVPAFMQQLGDEIKTGASDRSPLEFAASLHTKLVSIHPFIDGNGRTARLVLNACLLSLGLPVLVVNYADREQYLQCLRESNAGDLSSMVEFFLECFEQQLDDFAIDIREAPAEASGEVTVAVPPSLPEAETGLIDQAIQEIATPQIDSPLAAVMHEKILHQNEIRQATYDAWKQSFLTILAELKAIVEAFDANLDHIGAGYSMKLLEYDVLPFEKYDDICSGRKATRTWFAGLEIFGPQAREKLLWFFNHASRSVAMDPKASRVSLAVSRFDGTRYQRLISEPISLREIAYRDGELLFFSRDEAMSFRSVRQALESFLAEIIKSYL